LYRQFVNSDENDPGIEFIDERGQRRPADWPKDGVSLVELKMPDWATNGHANGSSNGNGHASTNGHKPTDTGRLHKQWVKAGSVSDFPKDGGSTIKHGDVQIAVYNFASRGEWYACQNMCPHKNAFVLSRGIVGSEGDEPKVACPLHKKPFSLKTGACLSGEEFSVKVFPVKVEDGDVYVELPPQEQLNALLSTKIHCIAASDTQDAMACIG
jgi:NAD(P)H-dependent nitrite reductase small subunit